VALEDCAEAALVGGEVDDRREVIEGFAKGMADQALGVGKDGSLASRIVSGVGAHALSTAFVRSQTACG
jgi:hypothetical protein